MRASYQVERLDYDLPPELIAQSPPSVRGQSRLLIVDAGAGTLRDTQFEQLLSALPPQTLVVLNDSRVVPARLQAQRESGGRVEVLFTRTLDAGRIEALVRSRGRLEAGENLLLPGSWTARLLTQKSLDGCELLLAKPVGEGEASAAPTEAEVLAFLEDHGEPPLPPYIKRCEGVEDADRERYQTVYASEPGSCAAPTAGLHFTPEILQAIEAAGHHVLRVTLHVGLGTFSPLRVDDLADHKMHSEGFCISTEDAKTYIDTINAGGPVLAVGTTSLRVLHTILGMHREIQGFEASLEGSGVCHGETSAFIYPGQGTEAATHLLTNFHLPRSSLLALVYAFGGEELLCRAYSHAIEQSYRFFSYGDCMLIQR